MDSPHRVNYKKEQVKGFIIYMTKLLQSDWLRGVQLFH